MGRIHSDEFKREAVRMALTSGLKRRLVAADLGIGVSTLAKWIQSSRPSDLPPAVDINLAKENWRLRKENRLLWEEREVLKKLQCFSPLSVIASNHREGDRRKANEICFRERTSKGDFDR